MVKLVSSVSARLETVAVMVVTLSASTLIQTTPLHAQRMMPFSFWAAGQSEQRFLAPEEERQTRFPESFGTDIDERSGKHPPILEVGSPFPSPFGPASPSMSQTAVLRFSVREATVVSIRMHDMLSAELDLLHEGVYQEGDHFHTIDPGDRISSGIYFLSIYAGSEAKRIAVHYMR